MRARWLSALSVPLVLSLSLSLTVGCSGGDEGVSDPPKKALAPKPPGKAKAKAKAKAVAEEPAAPVDPLAAARQAAWGGDADAAASGFAAKLSEGPMAWQGLVSAALAMGDTSKAVAALGDNGDAGLRALAVAEVHLAAGDGASALSAAAPAKADLPDAAAAVIARAVVAGGEVPGGDEADPTDPVVALSLFATSKDARAARAVTETAEAVAGWRAALLRGDVRAGWGEHDAAFAEYAKAAEVDDPEARVRANLARASLAASKSGTRGVEISVLDIASWAGLAAQGAVEGSDIARFDAAMKVLASTADRAYRPDLIAAAASAALEKAGEAAHNRADLRLTLARAALASGDPRTTKAQAALLKDDAERAEMAAWLDTWARWELRDAEGLKAAGDNLSGPRGLAARALHTALVGEIDAALREVPSTGLTDREFVYLSMAAAQVAGSGARDWLKRAVRHADRTKDLSLRIQTRLALEHSVRRADPALAAGTLNELARMVPPGPAGGALESELAARRLLVEGSAQFPEGDLPAVVKAWRSLAEGQVVTTEGPGVAAISKWAAGRAAIGAGQSGVEKTLSDAVSALPLYRWGWLATGTVLDGSGGIPYEDDLAALAGREPTEDVLGAALNAHEVGHLLDRAQADAAAGRDLLSGMDEASREGLLAAAAAFRAGVLRWQAGADSFPQEALESLEKAEAEAAKDNVFRTRVMPVAPPALAKIREVNGKMSILSYNISRGKVHGLVVTPRGGGIRDLGSARTVAKASADHANALMSGARTDGRASHAAGDVLRAALLDPFTQELSGQGWYVVLGPQSMRRFMFTTFPEQASGLRWLADIRTMAMLDSAGRINTITEDERDPERFRKGPDFLAFDSPEKVEAAPAEEEAPEEAPKAKAKKPKKGKKGKGKEAAGAIEEVEHTCTSKKEPPPNVRAANRFFDPEFRELCAGQQATLANYFELAPRARYIQLDSLEPTARGGFALGDGELDLTTVRSIPLVAELVILSASGTEAQQHQRARAFLDAGAQAVLFTAWDVPEGVHARMIDGFWAALKRDRPISRATAEGRDSLMRDALLGEDLDNPGLWGSVLLYTTP